MTKKPDIEKVKFITSRWAEISGLFETTNEFIQWYNDWLEKEIVTIFREYGLVLLESEKYNNSDNLYFGKKDTKDTWVFSSKRWDNISIYLGGYNYDYNEVPYIGIGSYQSKNRDKLISHIYNQLSADSFTKSGTREIFKTINIFKDTINEHLQQDHLDLIVEAYREAIEKTLKLGLEKIIDNTIKKINS